MRGSNYPIIFLLKNRTTPYYVRGCGRILKQLLPKHRELSVKDITLFLSYPLVGADEEQDAGVLAHDAGIDAVVIL